MIDAIVRRASPEDMPAVHMMGHDTWSEGQAPAEHVAACQASTKYLSGTWYVLDHDGQAVSALICYRNAFGLPERVMGIGSVATSPSHRRRGFASALISEVMARLSAERPIDAFLLYSDVDPAIYERLGFVRLDAEYQRYEESVAMICPGVKGGGATVGPGYRAPDYF